MAKARHIQARDTKTDNKIGRWIMGFFNSAKLQAYNKSGRWIPWAIVLFFVFLAGLFSWFVNLALSHNPGVIADKAYVYGLAYDKVIAKVAEQDALGWREDISLTRTDAATGKIVLKMTGKDGKPLTGLAVRYWLVRPSEANHDVRGTLTETAAGYEIAVPLALRGVWEVRIEAEQAAVDGKTNSFQKSKRFVLP
jgi:nitrogen fixation protein FixH